MALPLCILPPWKGISRPCSSSSTKEQTLKAKIVYVACINTHTRCSYIYSFIHHIYEFLPMLRYLFFLLRLSSDPSYVDQAMDTLHIYTLWIVYMRFLVHGYCVCMSMENTYIDNIQTHNHLNVVMSVCMHVCVYVIFVCNM